MCKNDNAQNSHSFLVFKTFLRAFFKVCINKFKMSIKFSFFVPIEKFFANLKYKGEKMYIVKHFAKSTMLFFANSYHSPLDSHKFEVLKPPFLRHSLPTVRHDRTRCVRVSNLEIQILCIRCCYMGHSRVDESRKFCSFRSSYLWDTSEELLRLGAGTFFIYFVAAPSGFPTSGIPVRNCCS
jgi:hypothetical protein